MGSTGARSTCTKGGSTCGADGQKHRSAGEAGGRNYYTVSCDTTEVRKLQELKRSAAGRTTRRFGDVRVSYTTLGFRRQQFHNHQNLGYEALERPLSKTFDTEGSGSAFPTRSAPSSWRSLRRREPPPCSSGRRTPKGWGSPCSTRR